ncbi:uracil-DNA glycosylase [Rhizorhabdus wittichii]|uniref:uracil-DNA glycosylase n=1 Tax=Rhizorhabdus wittichii TaxID=160791 RepID=UPI00031A745F|nr:uracil-DNA glycosylase [Rhizorhabdus wittichii]
MEPIAEPPADCALCPRLAAYRATQRIENPSWFNAPVPTFGDSGARLVIVGLAPGLKGANRTGRAFTGDGSGTMLFDVLADHGLARGGYGHDADDGLRLDGTVIVNAVRCVPPANRPTPAEVRTCRPFLAGPLNGAPAPRVIVALGRIAHDATLAALGETPARFRFAHGAEHRPEGSILIDSYHCSRYNQNTGRLTYKMLWSIFEKAIRYMSESPFQSPENIGNSAPKARERT